MQTISVRAARRLALCRAGLLRPDLTGLPRASTRGAGRLRSAAHEIVQRFGYLQLDTVSVAGARSHSIVLMSRLDAASPELGESLLSPGEPLFEYWGHEVCWLPIELYPTFGWRRTRFRKHPWWGDVIGAHPQLVREIMERVEKEGPLKSSDLEGPSGKGWWNHKPAKNVAVALWSAGDLVVRERRAFQRTFDLPRRVIPAEWLSAPDPSFGEALKILLRKALDGHGWAQTGTLAQTWRLRNLKFELQRALTELQEAGEIIPCTLVPERPPGRRTAGSRPPRGTVGWIRPEDLELAMRLETLRPTRANPVLLSPFDPVLWDRKRVAQLFRFEQAIEIFKPADTRLFGYYCLPILAGDRLVGRVDLKADRKTGKLRVVSRHLESETDCGRATAESEEAARVAVDRYARVLDLEVVDPRAPRRRPGTRRG
jgi:uncharacterized protein YcaQ